MNDYCPTCGSSMGIQPANDRVKRWLMRKLVAAPAGLNLRELTRAVASSDRDVLRVQIAQGLADGTIRRTENRRMVLQGIDQ